MILSVRYHCRLLGVYSLEYHCDNVLSDTVLSDSSCDSESQRGVETGVGWRRFGAAHTRENAGCADWSCRSHQTSDTGSEWERCETSMGKTTRASSCWSRSEWKDKRTVATYDRHDHHAKRDKTRSNLASGHLDSVGLLKSTINRVRPGGTKLNTTCESYAFRGGFSEVKGNRGGPNITDDVNQL